MSVLIIHHALRPDPVQRYQGHASQWPCAAASARGEAAADTKLVTLALFGLCNWAYQWFDVRGRYTAEEIAETYWRLLLKGIQPESQRH